MFTWGVIRSALRLSSPQREGIGNNLTWQKPCTRFVNPKKFAILFASACASSTVQAGCLNNSIEFKSDAQDGTYFYAQKIKSTIQPQELFKTLDGRSWLGEEPPITPGSRLDPKYTLAWSIEVHYSDDTIDTIGEWKESQLTGNRYAVLRGKHVPSDLTIPYPPSYRSQINTHLSLRNIDRQTDWDELNILINDVLQDRNGNSVPGYGALTRSSPTRDIIGKLAKWIKNKRLKVGMDGGGGVEGFIHPVDFMREAPSYCQGAASTLTMMAAQLGIPARLGETFNHSWAEVLIDGRWMFVENQPETFLDTVYPPIPVWSYSRNGRQVRGYMPQTEAGYIEGLNRSAVMQGGLIDIIANPVNHGLVEGLNRYSWFFNWANPFNYGEDGERAAHATSITIRPEVYSDSVFNYYMCEYSSEHNSSQCGGPGRQFQVAERYNSMRELSALYPNREDDLPYVCAKDEGDDTNVMYLTPIRDNNNTNEYLSQSQIPSGGGVRKQFYLSDKEGIEAVYAVLYLGPEHNYDYTIPEDGGDWYYSVNGRKTYLSTVNGLLPADESADDVTANGIVSNYLGLKQRALRYKLDLDILNEAQTGCSGGIAGIAGARTLQSEATEDFLGNRAEYDWNPAAMLGSAQSAGSEWEFIEVTPGSNQYRIRSSVNGMYLHNTGSQAGSTVTTGVLNPDWTSQIWTVENVDNNRFRLKNRWGGNYLAHLPNESGARVTTRALDPNDPDQVWVLR